MYSTTVSGPAGVDLFAAYLRKIGRRALLTREGEVEVAKRIERAAATHARARSQSRVAAAWTLRELDRLHRGERSLAELFGPGPSIRPLAPLGSSGASIDAAQLQRCRRRLRGALRDLEGSPPVERVAKIDDRIGAALAILPDSATWASDLERSWTELCEATRHAHSDAEREALARPFGLSADQVLSDVRRFESTLRDLDRAKADMIESNLRLVVSVAKRYRGSSLSFLDLIQEGNMGLMKAVDRFDFRRGYRFSTYATWWIRQSITRAVANKDRPIRLPVHTLEALRKIRSATRELAEKSERRPSTQEIADRLEMPVQRVESLLQASADVASLEAPVGEDATLGDFVAHEDAPDPVNSLTAEQLRETTEHVLSQLTLRERRILRDRFGLDGQERTLAECGETFGITRERVRQIANRALDKIRGGPGMPELTALLDAMND